MTDKDHESFAGTPDGGRRQRRLMMIVRAYPGVLILIGVLVNLFVFGVDACVVALPSIEIMRALVIAAVLLTVNHTWIMSATELTRVRFSLCATPEDWIASGRDPDAASEEGIREVDRHLRTHRNATENTVYYLLLSLILAFTTPDSVAAQVWILLFPVGRLGHTFGYLAAKTQARGLFMSLSLLSLYGMASYLVIALVV